MIFNKFFFFKTLLFYNTLRYLKFTQIFHRLILILYRPNIQDNFDPILNKHSYFFVKDIPKNQSLIGFNTFNFIGIINKRSEFSWNLKNKPKLWLYNLHYFDDLNSLKSEYRNKLHKKLIINWIDINKSKKGIGWDPYPTSLRLVNWIKWYLKGNKLNEKFLKSIGIQSRWLNKNLEYHLLGNHLFSNAKALYFAGLFFKNKEAETWLKKSIKIINKELEEQVLPDGGHFERSIMYHCIFFEDLLDIINISKLYRDQFKNNYLDYWSLKASKMQRFLEGLIHPDRQIPFFNDSSFGICAMPEQLFKYASRLGLKEIKNNVTSKNKKYIKSFLNTGYVRVQDRSITALLDIGKIGPDYLTGHAHADTLSFELSIKKKRFIVNGGTSTYEVGKRRQKERETSNHSTLEINGKSSSEVWKSFRVAKRAYPHDVKLLNKNGIHTISCSHNGYKRLMKKVIHNREWKFDENIIYVNDKILGNFKKAHAKFILHPDIKIKRIFKKKYKLYYSSGTCVIFEVIKGSAKIQVADYAPYFGDVKKTKCIIVNVDRNKSSIKIIY